MSAKRKSRSNTSRSSRSNSSSRVNTMTVRTRPLKTSRTQTARPQKTPASLVWFEIPANNIERARAFYGNMFGWKITPFANMEDYWHIDTGGGDQTPDGGLMTRMYSQHTITNYILVPSVSDATAKVKKLGGKICKTKTEVPQMGYFAICEDTEGNEFAVWEMMNKSKRAGA